MEGISFRQTACGLYLNPSHDSLLIKLLDPAVVVDEQFFLFHCILSSLPAQHADSHSSTTSKQETAFMHTKLRQLLVPNRNLRWRWKISSPLLFNSCFPPFLPSTQQDTGDSSVFFYVITRKSPPLLSSPLSNVHQILITMSNQWSCRLLLTGSCYTGWLHRIATKERDRN